MSANTPWSSLPETGQPSALPEMGQPFSLPEPPRWGRFLQHMGRALGLGLITALILFFLFALAGIGVYAYYAASLPYPQELYERTTPFKSTKIYDRHGRLLFEVFDPTAGRRTVVPYEQIPPVVIEATIATEDATFFSNPGFNPLAILRALYQDLREREVVSGASTITQQLVKNLFLTREVSLSRKIKEAILATEITRRYSKQEILEIYLNEVYYGNLAYGLGAAAETYFGKRVAELNLTESALLAGMLQSPAFYDPYTDPQATLARRNTVLRLMRGRGYITAEQMEEALQQPLTVVPRKTILEAPHMVVYVREQLEQAYGTEVLYKGGLQVYTTLDLDLQHLAEEVARAKVEELRKSQAGNAALVAMDPQTGDVLAMLGSADFYDATIDGQVNVARSLRQPGSAIKPLTYLVAMERGWNAATMVMDLKQQFPDGANPPYEPRNYDDKEYGPTSVRMALANSRNIPAVATLHQVGLPALLEMARRLGINSLDRPDYGLSLTLGGGEVTLLELTAAYAALDNGGRRVIPRTILRIEDQLGNVLVSESAPDMPQVVDPRLAYIITDILSDNQARTPSFGPNSVLVLSGPAAAKTGTTNDYRDSWTMGYTPGLVTGVWVGNSDNRPMERVPGSRGAGLIWHDFMERALAGKPVRPFVRPEGVVEAEVCPVSGYQRTDLCPPPKVELFLKEKVPQDECPVHHRIAVCQVSGKLATQFCPPESVEQRSFEDYGAEWDTWARKRGLEIPPRELCPVHTMPVQVSISAGDSPLSGIVQVRGSTQVPEFAHYVVEYGLGPEPLDWKPLSLRVSSPVAGGILVVWDTREYTDGVYALRLVVFDGRGNRREARQVVEIHNAMPTPYLSPTPVASETALPTATWLPVVADTASPTATWFPSMTHMPPPTATPVSPTVTPERARETRTRKPKQITDTPTAMPTETPTPSATPTLVLPEQTPASGTVPTATVTPPAPLPVGAQPAVATPTHLPGY